MKARYAVSECGPEAACKTSHERYIYRRKAAEIYFYFTLNRVEIVIVVIIAGNDKMGNFTDLLVVVSALIAICRVKAREEAHCSRYHYEEQILTKVIKLENRLERIEETLEAKTACADDWTPFQSSCYYFGTVTMEFDEAEALCKMSGAHLVSIHNSAENDFLKRHVSGNTHSFWIGMTDEATENDWIWTDTGVKVQFFDWNPGEPNQGRSANCGALYKTFAHRWVDEPCTGRQFRPICKK